MKEFEVVVGLKRETPEPVSIDDMRKAIEIGGRHSSLIHSVQMAAMYRGLSGEDKYVLLAYHALTSLQDYICRELHFELHFLERNPMPPMIIASPPQTTGDKDV